MDERIKIIQGVIGKTLIAVMNGHPVADLEGAQIAGQALRFIAMIRERPDDFDEPDATIEEMLQTIETRLRINHA